MSSDSAASERRWSIWDEKKFETGNLFRKSYRQVVEAELEPLGHPDDLDVAVVIEVGDLEEKRCDLAEEEIAWLPFGARQKLPVGARLK